MIEVEHLVRRFEHKNGFFKKAKATKVAVNDISFSIKKGETFALLGPNGAGKTTTIKILSTLLAPSEGSCKILGYDTFHQAKKIRANINFIFGGESGVYRRISARENMEYFASLYHMGVQEKTERIQELLALVNLSDVQDNKVETFSKGMIQRLQIARGLLNDPDVIFMDEPTIGLDPIGARDLRNIIFSLKEQKKTILLTTHDMNEADILSDRIALINHGEILALDTPEHLKQRFMNENIIEIDVTHASVSCVENIKKLACVSYATCHEQEYGEHFHIQYCGSKNFLKEILACIDGEIQQIKERGNSLEDVYIRLIEEHTNDK